jgi:DNA-binding winged helix-turn-helix (wHTH) protein
VFNAVQSELKGELMESESHIAFGPFRLELGTSQTRLWRGDRALTLRARSLAVLRYLLEHPGRLVTKAELRQHVWGGMLVTDTVLRVCIHDIRVALDDDAAAPQYLETVGGQGYQWLVRGERSAPPLLLTEARLRNYPIICARAHIVRESCTYGSARGVPDAVRAGIEGTISQGGRAFGMRRSRYIGLAKRISNRC